LAQAKLSDAREPTGLYRQHASTHSWKHNLLSVVADSPVE